MSAEIQKAVSSVPSQKLDELRSTAPSQARLSERKAITGQVPEGFEMLETALVEVGENLRAILADADMDELSLLSLRAIERSPEIRSAICADRELPYHCLYILRPAEPYVLSQRNLDDLENPMVILQMSFAFEGTEAERKTLMKHLLERLKQFESEALVCEEPAEAVSVA